MKPLACLLSVAVALGGSVPGAAAVTPPPVAGLQEPASNSLAAEVVRADLDEMYGRLKRAHIDLYAFIRPAELDEIVQSARMSINGPMERSEVETLFQGVLSHVKMGHTRIEQSREAWNAYRDAGAGYFPVDSRLIEGRLYVVQALDGTDALQAGDEILSIQGRDVPTLVSSLRRYVSAETDYMFAALLEWYLPRLLWLDEGPVETFDLSVRRGADTLAVTIAAVSRTDQAKHRLEQPPRLDLETPLREARILEPGLAYLRPGPFYNAEDPDPAEMYDGAVFNAFIDGAFRSFLDAGAATLILDLRSNPGGDISFSDPMIAWFADRPFRFFSAFDVRVSPEAIAANQARLDHDPSPSNTASHAYADLYGRSTPGSVVQSEMPLYPPRAGPRFTGDVYVLIDRHSYSNAAITAAIIQDYGFGVLMGEPTSEMGSTYGAMETFNLPRTGITVGFPKAHIIRPSGDQRSTGVTPDIPLPTPLVQSPSDEVLQSAIQAIRRQRAEEAGGR